VLLLSCLCLKIGATLGQVLCPPMSRSRTRDACAMLLGGLCKVLQAAVFRVGSLHFTLAQKQRQRAIPADLRSSSSAGGASRVVRAFDGRRNSSSSRRNPKSQATHNKPLHTASHPHRLHFPLPHHRDRRFVLCMPSTRKTHPPRQSSSAFLLLLLVVSIVAVVAFASSSSNVPPAASAASSLAATAAGRSVKACGGGVGRTG